MTVYERLQSMQSLPRRTGPHAFKGPRMAHSFICRCGRDHMYYSKGLCFTCYRNLTQAQRRAL